MAEEPTPQNTTLPSPVETRPEVMESLPTIGKVESAVENIASADPIGPPKEVAPAPTIDVEAVQPVAPASIEPEPVVEKEDHESANDKQPTSVKSNLPEDEPAIDQEDVETNPDVRADVVAPAAEPAGDAAASTEASGSKSNSKARRKSGGVPEHKTKKLNKKASKAKMTHIDAAPGDYFMIRLKGYPLWPGIVCDETMLPNTLLKHRPATAARPDGTFRDAYADGGAKVNDRTFPVMYLHTNEFSWTSNTDLVDMDVETVGTVTSTMRKDLAAAHVLAAEQHDLEFFKEILKNFMEQRAADLEAREAAKAAKKAEKAAKAEKSTKQKRKSKAVADEDEDAEGDIEMADAPADLELENVEADSGKKNKKKRKASDDVEDSPKTDSVKKPKTTIKLTTTPKANGTSTPKSVKDSTTKSAKPKLKKATAKAAEEPEIVAAPKEPELTPEEKRQKKEKEILFLRHKLQKGLLTKEQEPKEDEMKQMSEYVNKLEGYADLEVSIIRATKINKVLKAILKVPTIPKEDEFQFKARSQSLLDKWNKLLASEHGTPAATTAPTNGVKEETRPEVEDTKATSTTTNGTKESSTEEKVEEKAPAVEEAVAKTQKEEAPKVEEAPALLVENPAQEPNPEPTSVESTE